ncbi:hypothetical protein EJ05DRAFT_498266 [Pseudovirgaria hyperparasitica]|uniref:Hydrophobin n=1 Tax=Pseudovirgaria hyperparasitica TaxID=470096 RepID=A0A6A6WBU4_9PEZI|nr:uncharacterized protein EJ05DRAFT_498266 [Pseudovirgaria hyperparasitica]KAF2760302.1 hypothetical protein EJ05DRAFT_498266 [Pseudovirgaria hyperparasitica]
MQFSTLATILATTTTLTSAAAVQKRVTLCSTKTPSAVCCTSPTYGDSTGCSGLDATNVNSLDDFIVKCAVDSSATAQCCASLADNGQATDCLVLYE